MAKIPLQSYQRQIEALCAENRFEEAGIHCRHILEQHPRHLNSYRLLGKSLLMSKQDADAADVFRRVLSADPEDFDAHLGLAVVGRRAGQAAKQKWHLERAFGLEPYNEFVRQELATLSESPDNTEAGGYQLTGEALSHLYVRGELYREAIAQLCLLLVSDPGRVDLQATLAEALWRDNQRVAAVDICLKLLEQLPYCLKANAILAEIWLSTDRVEDAQRHLDRIQEMLLLDRGQIDRDEPAGAAFSTDGASSLPDQVLVHALRSDRGRQDKAADNWIAEMGLAENQLLEGVGERERVIPAWLKAMQVDAPGEPGEDAQTAGEPATRNLHLLGAALALEMLSEDDDPGDATEKDTAGISLEKVVDEDVVDEDVVDGGVADEGMSGGAVDENGEEVDVPDASDRETISADEWPAGHDVPLLESNDLDGSEESQDGEMSDWLTEDLIRQEAAVSNELPGWLQEGNYPFPVEVEEADPGQVEIVDPEATDVLFPPEWLPGSEPNEMQAERRIHALAAGIVALAVRKRTSGNREEEQQFEAEESPMSTTEKPDQMEGIDAGSGQAADETSDELQATLAWLGELAAKQGVPVEELPGLYDAEELYPDWLTKDVADVPTGAIAMTVAESEPSASLADSAGDGESAQDGVPEWLRESVEELSDENEDSHSAAIEPKGAAAAGFEEADDLGWLDQIAAGAGAAIEEPPTLSWERSGLAEEAPGADAHLSWLDDFSAPTTASDPEPIERSVVAEDAGVANDPEPIAQSLTNEDIEEEVPDQKSMAKAAIKAAVAAALAGERRSAEREPEPDAVAVQDKVETPASVADHRPLSVDSESVSDDVPEDLDEAMVWLEQRTTQPRSAEEISATLEGELPDDTSEALAWLEALAASEIAAQTGAAELEPFEVVEEPITPAVAHDVVAAKAQAELLSMRGEATEPPYVEPEIGSVEDLVASIPDDPDAAMAWLEQLAAQQSASLDEALAADETTDVTPEPSAPQELDQTSEMKGSVATAGELPPEEPEPGDMELSREMERTLAAAIPAWLAKELAHAPEELPEDGEQESTGELELPEDEEDIRPEPLEADSEPAAVLEPPAEPETEEATAQFIETSDETSVRRATGLELAKEAIDAGDISSALARLEQTLAGGENIDEVIRELEGADLSGQHLAEAQRLLGDAYLQKDEPQKALDIYASALDLL